ncbi:autotransporter domain-containing protein [bacterium BD-1]|nr:autotransporter domain-containing protein [Ottowia caeni]
MTAIQSTPTGSRPRPWRDFARRASQLACLGLLGLGLAAPAAALPSLSVADAFVLEGTGGTTELRLVISLDAPAGPGGVSVDAGPIMGTALANLDFVPGSHTYTIPEGQTSTRAVIQIVGDAIDEPNETFTVHLANPVGAIYADSFGEVTILDDDAAPTISINSVTVVERDTGEPMGATLVATLDAPSGRTVRVDYATADGTARAWDDYEPASGTLTFNPGQTQRVLGTNIVGDLEPEHPETFTFELSNPVDAILANGTGTVTVTDNEAFPLFSVDDPSVVEGDDGNVEMVYTVRLDQPGKAEAIAVYATVAGGTATFQTDYADTRGSLSIPAGQTEVQIAVPVLPDVLVEGPETIRFDLGYPINALIAKGTGMGTIVDNDAPLAITPDSLPAASIGNALSATLSATGGSAPYRFTLAGGSLPSGVTLSEDGSLAGVPTDGGNFGFSVAVQDSFAGGPRTGSRNYVLAVAAPDVLAPANLPGGQFGAAYDAALPLSGTAPFQVTLSSGQLPPGLQLGANGRITGVPGVPGSFDFIVAATDSSGGTGPYGDTQAYRIVVSNIAPVAEDFSTSLPYNAGATTVPALSSGGIATDYIVASQPAHGVATGGAGGLKYTPARGFSGVDSFQYQLANDAGTSAPATLTITVGEPSISARDSGPATATVGQPYSRTVTWSGGTGPYRAQAVSGLPAGLRASATSDTTLTISGTPEVAGRFRLQASTQDSSTGRGPFSGSATLELEVAAPALVLSPADASVFAARYDAAFSQRFIASGGVGAYTYALDGTLPPGLVFAGDTLSGTPRASGRFAFTVTAADTGSSGPGAPFTVSADYVLEVEAPAITVSPDSLPAATAGQAYAAAVSAAGGVAPYRFTLLAGALPEGLALGDEGQLTGTPTQLSEHRFTVQAEDANGERGSRELVLVVDATPVTAVSRTVPVLAAVATEVELAAGATGGPITGATLVSLSPAQAGRAVVEARDGGWVLRFTADAAFSGDAVATFTLHSTYATSAPATITFQVGARPDPSEDPEVGALLDAQVSASRRFGEAQIGNFQQRLARLHRGDAGGFENRLGVAAGGGEGCPGPVLPSYSAAIECAMGAGRNPAAAGGGKAGALSGAGWGAWAAGSVRSGRQDGRAGEVVFESDGLSLGLDRRVREDLVLGFGLGWGRDDNAVGDNGSRMDGKARTLAVYASWHPGARGFLDVVLGLQSLDYQILRHVGASNALVGGQRDGEQWFASLSTGADLGFDQVRATPYARLDLMRTTLDAYTETGDPVWALAHGPMDLDHALLSGGMRLDFTRELAWGALTPQLRVEYRHVLEGRGDTWVRYADLPGATVFNAVGRDSNRNRLVLGLGASLAARGGWLWQLEIGGELTGDGESGTGVQLGVQKQF